jgi:hypothetical protein
LDKNIPYSIASGEKIYDIGKTNQAGGCVQALREGPADCSIFYADIRALARMPVAVVTPARATQVSEVIHASAIADVRNRVDANIDAEGVEASRRPEGQKSAKRVRRNDVRAVMRRGYHNRDELCHNGVGNVQDRIHG